MFIGDFHVEGDETFFNIESRVLWRSGAEHLMDLAAEDESAIEHDSVVRGIVNFTAAPTHRWLVSVADTMRAQMGDLDDDMDDLLLELSRGTVFQGTAIDGGNPRNYIHYIPDEPVAPGEEPCGGEAHKTVWHPQDWWLVYVEEDADVECDGTGTLHRLREFRDGSIFETTITWDGAGGATIQESRPSGVSIAGTWNEATGEYEVETTFPDGHDPVSRLQSGVTGDGEVEAWDIFTWQDAHADSTYFNMVETNDVVEISGFEVNSDVREDFTLTVNADETVTGTWTRNDGANGAFAIELLEGGGSYLVYTAEDPQADGSPSVEGEIWFAEDGSGYGTVSFTQYGITVVMDITFGPDGTGSLTDDTGNVLVL
jgi:hypothetical protein